jgi:preprotein translocase subunit YajC
MSEIWLDDTIFALLVLRSLVYLYIYKREREREREREETLAMLHFDMPQSYQSHMMF